MVDGGRASRTGISICGLLRRQRGSAPCIACFARAVSGFRLLATSLVGRGRIRDAANLLGEAIGRGSAGDQASWPYGDDEPGEARILACAFSRRTFRACQRV